LIARTSGAALGVIAGNVVATLREAEGTQQENYCQNFDHA